MFGLLKLFLTISYFTISPRISCLCIFSASTLLGMFNNFLNALELLFKQVFKKFVKKIYLYYIQNKIYKYLSLNKIIWTNKGLVQVVNSLVSLKQGFEFETLWMQLPLLRNSPTIGATRNKSGLIGVEFWRLNGQPKK